MVRTTEKTFNIRTLHKKIALRLAITGLVLSIIFGGTAFWYLERMHAGQLHPSDIFRISIGFACIIMLTSLLLYPAVISLTDKLGRLTLNLFHSNMETLEFMGNAISKRESETEAHNYRVTLYAVRLAEVAGLGARQIQGLIKGAFLHDVGKIGISDRILLKPGSLNTAEVQTMKDQAQFGVNMVTQSEWLDDANQVVAYHHERYDGTGYFAGLRGEEIPVVARIFTIANVFEALTTQRPYKKPLPLAEAIEVLNQDKGTHFDPDLVDAFTGIIPTLYSDYISRDEEALKRILAVTKERYFRESTVFH
jgi:HD-GYP domain-containing protein (c-di-GMP phosphodiesterase class II)